MQQEIERYRRPTRVLHWVIVGAFCALFLTGLVLFIPQLTLLAVGGWTRLVHRIAAVLFVVAPLIYILLNWKASLRGIADAFTWGMEDIGWLVAAPRYYFLADEEAMPPQEHMNSGQKLWWLMVIVFGLIFVVTGLILWAFKTIAPSGLLQWAIAVHDVAFIVTGSMFFIHIYLSVLHPLMGGAWGSMSRGRVSVDYARAHHAKWYERISKTGEGDTR